MHAKEVLVPGGLVAEKLVDGSAALALHQQSEILQVKAPTWWVVTAAIQNYTVYAGAVAAHSASAVAARAFLTMFAEPAARKAIEEHGLLPEDR
jgi:molybdate transport system substrate-binding protein